MMPNDGAYWEGLKRARTLLYLMLIWNKPTQSFEALVLEPTGVQKGQYRRVAATKQIRRPVMIDIARHLPAFAPRKVDPLESGNVGDVILSAAKKLRLGDELYERVDNKGRYVIDII
jgi:hypothetical protein